MSINFRDYGIKFGEHKATVAAVKIMYGAKQLGFKKRSNLRELFEEAIDTQNVEKLYFLLYTLKLLKTLNIYDPNGSCKFYAYVVRKELKDFS